MNILLLPCHSILEYDEYKLFTELGHEVFSLGSYVNPHTPHDPKRPPIMEAKYNERFCRIRDVYNQDNLHEDWIAWADVIIVHHVGRWIVSNWEKMKHKKVVWRTIGQSVQANEDELKPYREQGMKIVRYSPMEQNIPGFIGSDAMIRFYKDPEEYKDWNGSEEKIVTFMQDVTRRRDYLNFNSFVQATEGMNRILFGPDNQNITEVPTGGSLSNDDMKKELRNARIFFYTGTQPASYTLGFMEAWMTGTPIVAVGPSTANSIFKLNLYEVNSLINNGVDGYCFDDTKELKFYCSELLKSNELAEKISKAGRESAIRLFGKETIKSLWDTYLKSL